MSYTVHITAEGGIPAKIEAKSSSLAVGLGDNTWTACVSWCRRTLGEDAESYVLVSRSWPGREFLSLMDRSGREVFYGKVSKVKFTDTHITVEAADLAVDPNSPMEVEVTTDVPGSRRAFITVDNKGNGPVNITFGDGSPDGSNPGDGVTQSFHEYGEGGIFDILVQDADNAARNFSYQVAVPFPAGS